MSVLIVVCVTGDACPPALAAAPAVLAAPLPALAARPAPAARPALHGPGQVQVPLPAGGDRRGSPPEREGAGGGAGLGRISFPLTVDGAIAEDRHAVPRSTLTTLPNCSFPL